jgi:hypothetical protein
MIMWKCFENKTLKYQKEVRLIMNLDLAIQNALKRTPMQGAMHTVASNYGQQFELHSVHHDIKIGQNILGHKVATTSNSGVIHGAVKESQKLGMDANEFSRTWTPTTETMIPISTPLSKDGPIGHFTNLPIGNTSPPSTQLQTATLMGAF